MAQQKYHESNENLDSVCTHTIRPLFSSEQVETSTLGFEVTPRTVANNPAALGMQARCHCVVVHEGLRLKRWNHLLDVETTCHKRVEIGSVGASEVVPLEAI